MLINLKLELFLSEREITRLCEEPLVRRFFEDIEKYGSASETEYLDRRQQTVFHWIGDIPTDADTPKILLTLRLLCDETAILNGRIVPLERVLNEES